MHKAMLAFAAGILLLQLLPVLPGNEVLLVVALVALPWLASRLHWLGWGLLGLAWACLSASVALDQRLPQSLDGRTLWVEGRISGLPEVDGRGARFLLVGAQSRRARLSPRIRVSWVGAPTLREGEHWRLALTLRRPRGTLNPGAFDYEAWLLAQRIGASATVKAGERLAAARGVHLRERLRQALLQVPAQGRNGGLAALVVGDGSGLSAVDWKVLQDTGTVHLMVISGQHVSMLAALVYALVAGLYRLGCWPLAWPWLPCACLGAMLAALGYGLLAGFEVPVQRACIMLGLVLLWRWRMRRLQLLTPWLAALCLVLFIEPLSGLQAGFWLSFIACFLLFWLFAGRLGRWSWWHSLWRGQWGMSLGLLPILLGLALPYAFSGVLANLLAVPWVGWVVVPLALLGSLLLPLEGVGSRLLWLAGAALQVTFEVLGWMAELAPAWQAAQAPTWALWLGALGALLCLAPRGIPLHGLGALLLLPLLLPRVERPAQAEAWVQVLDVGQGQAVLIRTRQHALLYDSGPASDGLDFGERVVVPVLKGLGVAQLDQLLLSHADNDHAGGALAVLHGLQPRQVVSGEAQRLPTALAASTCEAREWTWDGVRFRTWQWSAARSSNDASCVLWVEAGGERLLLTGDLGQQGEQALLASPGDWQADWLVVGHHGSRSSSSLAFLRQVGPHSAVISRGWLNAHGHPHPWVVARLGHLRIRVLDTAVDGGLAWRLGASQPGVVQRQRHLPRFWRTVGD